MEAKLVTAAKKRIEHVQKHPEIAPKVKVRAHCACIFIAVVLTATIPSYVHMTYLSAFTIAGPNFLQELIDRIFHL